MALSVDVWHVCAGLRVKVSTSGLPALRHERRCRDGTGQHAMFDTVGEADGVRRHVVHVCITLYYVVGARDPAMDPIHVMCDV